MGLKTSLLSDYQLDAIKRMKNGCILCGGVGSGKSRTALGYFHKVCGGRLEPFEMMKKPKDLYIITTARKRDSLEWDSELALFLLSTNKNANSYSTKVIVDSWNNIKKYSKEIQDSFFIFDEQRLIGSGAWVKAFYEIADKNSWILLSATPGDTWSDYIPVFVANGFYKNKTEFIRRHAVYSYYSKYPKIVKYLDIRRLEELQKQILVTMDYTKETVRHVETIIVDYDKDLYRLILKKRKNPFKENKPIRNVSELGYLLRFVLNSDPSRIEEILKLAENHPKMIIFYNFNYEKDILKAALWPRGTAIAEYNGTVHMDIPKTDRWVYLVQYHAGSEAWNCVETDTMIFYSLNYSYRMMEQASGRIDRRNTPYINLFYYYIRSSAPLDKGIEYTLQKKEDFNERKFFN